MVVKFPCAICNRAVARSHRGIQCDICSQWVHIKCNNTNLNEYERLQHDDSNWACNRCYNKSSPFQDLSNELLKLNLQGKNISNKICDPEETSNAEFYRNIESFIKQPSQSCVCDDYPNCNCEASKCPYLTLSDLNNLQDFIFSPQYSFP